MSCLASCTHWSNNDINAIGVTNYFLIEIKACDMQDGTQTWYGCWSQEPMAREVTVPMGEPITNKMTMRDSMKLASSDFSV